MGYTNSSLVNYTKISPNRTINRNHAIDTITIHCVVGQLSVETLGNVFADKNREASSNYGIGYDGKIGMYCEEKDRSWCSSNRANDNRAITIEVASDTKEPYAITTKAYNSLIKLLVDVCKRNGIKELKWKADKSLIGQVDKQNMTVHRWFANKSCPGTYLYSNMGKIAAEVNKQLTKTTSTTTKTETAKTTTTTLVNSIKVGSTVRLASNATYYDGSSIPSWVKSTNWIVSEVKDNRAVINKSADGKNAINSAVNTKYLTVVSASKTTSSTFKSYVAKVKVSNLAIREGAGTNYKVTGYIKDKGSYTIIAESKGTGSTKGWGKLKSGAGWISLDYVTKV